MSATRIGTTSSDGLRLLGQEGQRSHEMLTALVGARLGPAHARLFAEPVVSDRGDETDWYTDAPGRAEPLGALPEDEAEAARTTLQALTGDVSALADRLRAEGGDSNARLAESLSNALEIPDPDAVLVVTDATGARQPVLINWARVREDAPSGRGVLSRMVPAAPTALAEPLPQSGAGGGAGTLAAGGAVAEPATPMWLSWLWWLLWLLLALIMLAVLYLLIAACGVRGGSFQLTFCPAEEVVVAPDRGAEHAALLDRVRDLERQLIAANAACDPVIEAPPAPSPAPAPPPPAPEPVPEPEPAQRTEIDDRLESAGGQVGDMNVSLAWEGPSDVDLHVTCPAGVRIYYANRTAQACRGSLDVDANAGGRRTDTPIENIFFEDPLPGAYQIRVHLFSARGGVSRVPFVLQVRVGEETNRFEGEVTSSRPDWRTTFTYTE
jgi:hypothetical protein